MGCTATLGNNMDLETVLLHGRLDVRCNTQSSRHLLTCPNSAWWISNRERPKSRAPALNATLPELRNTTTSDAAGLENFFEHPAVRAISADIVAGQIIATIIVVAFVAIFLLREWISQNARPGIFDDGDGPPEGQQPAPEIIVQAEPMPPAIAIPPVVPVRDATPPRRGFLYSCT